MIGGQLMNQDDLRKRLRNYITIEGVRQNHIAEQANMSESLLSRFKNGTDLLYRCDIEALDNYLTSKGY